MLDPLVITLIVGVLVWDGLVGAEGVPVGDAWSAGLGVASPLVIAAITHLRMTILTRRLDRGGGVRLLVRGERTMLAARAAIGACYLGAVLGGAWVEQVRLAIGDLVLVDEFLAILPALVGLVWLWGAYYPIELRIREAMAMRTLDAGDGLHAPPTRAQHVLDLVRHRALIALVPIGIIAAWVEGLQRLVSAGVDRGWMDLEQTRWQVGVGGAEVAGVLATLVLTPPIIRRIWNTVPLGAGALRDRIRDLCRRQRVRVAEILVWRTHGSTLNAAVMGVFGPARYVLLSDALLERLPDDELEAVVAHEAGHARRRHLPWLMAAVGGTIALAGVIAELTTSTLPQEMYERWGLWIDAGVLGAGVLASMWPLGVVSRRFERQADAFAVQHLSGMTGGRASGDLTATPEAAQAMAGALERVARLSHIPSERFTWRHGSIGARRRAILALVGTPLNAFPIDRLARRTKRATLALVLLVIAVASWRVAAAERNETDRPAWADRSAWIASLDR